MSGFTAVDLSQMPVPALIDELNYETILAEMKADLISRDPAMADVLSLESEPSLKILQVAAFRELIVRQRVNEAAKATMLAYAAGTDLDHRGANLSTPRLLITPADPNTNPPTEAVYESDDNYRRRIQLSMEGISTAGPEGAYIFHALSADAAVLDVSVTSPAPDDIKQLVLDVLAANGVDPALVTAMQTALDAANWPGDVIMTVLSSAADGTADQTLLDAVYDTLSADDVRPLTDNVIVQSATAINYSIDATLYFYSGPVRTVVMQQAQDAIDLYVEQQHHLGLDITLSGIYAALHQPGVQRVELTSPPADIVIDKQSASYCTGITLTDGGLDE